MVVSEGRRSQPAARRTGLVEALRTGLEVEAHHTDLEAEARRIVPGEEARHTGPGVEEHHIGPGEAELRTVLEGEVHHTVPVVAGHRTGPVEAALHTVLEAEAHHTAHLEVAVRNPADADNHLGVEDIVGSAWVVAGIVVVEVVRILEVGLLERY